MTPKEAAGVLRPTFHLYALPVGDRHYVKFVEAVAAELGIEHTVFNLYQVAAALTVANIKRDGDEYPKMLYSRQFPKGHAAVYDPRHDHVSAIVRNDEELDALGAGWVTDFSTLPLRDGIPLYAPPQEKPTEPTAPAEPQPEATAEEAKPDEPEAPAESV